MQRRILLKSKIHRVKVTDSNLNYEGSLTIDPVLMEQADLLPFEKIDVVNINNSHRFSTYVIKGQSGSGEICLNGGAARLGEIDDKLIIISYVDLADEEARQHKPIIVLVDENNSIKSIQK